jgi:hypothetical protein
MGLGNFLKSVVDREFLGRDIVKKQIEIYYQQKNLYPDQAQHVHLAQVWLSRQSAHGHNISSPEMQMLSYTETLLCACVPHPQCAEALGLYILYKERPDIINDYPHFCHSFEALIGPVMQAQEDGKMEALYRKYNPNVPKEYMEILFGEA